MKLSSVVGIVPLSFQLTSDCCLLFLLRYYFLAFPQYKECLDCDSLSLQNTCQEKHCLIFFFNLPKNQLFPLPSGSFLSNRTPFFSFYDTQQRGRKSHVERTIQGNREIRARFSSFPQKSTTQCFPCFLLNMRLTKSTFL